EMTGRMQTFADVFGSRQQDLTRVLGERMDSMTHRLGQNLAETNKSTHDNLKALGERLAVIDRAQSNITILSSQVVELQSILANKQTRGAFGQARMEAIVADGLAQGSFAFQAILSNGTRPDCVVFMPNDAPDLVIDAKFPLEAWNTVRNTENPEVVKAAQTQFRRDIEKHIKDIAERYLIAGETQDTAFMFVPSESIFADIHEHYEDIIQKAHRSRVVLVSPSLLMLSIQVVQTVLRDQRMREQAHIIQKEVMALMQDVARLDDRVDKLQAHFQQSTKDIDLILTSTRKITSRGAKIEALDFSDRAGDLEPTGNIEAADTKKAAQSSNKPGQPDLLEPDLLAGE
ncbi:MAG: DNA recombination protein RmuC, partial [Pseudomonadota bacterium]